MFSDIKIIPSFFRSLRLLYHIFAYLSRSLQAEIRTDLLRFISFIPIQLQIDSMRKFNKIFLCVEHHFSLFSKQRKRLTQERRLRVSQYQFQKPHSYLRGYAPHILKKQGRKLHDPGKPAASHALQISVFYNFLFSLNFFGVLLKLFIKWLQSENPVS